MNLTQVQKQWVEALRSGKYQQGRFRLKRGEKYCCLGVLCNLAKQAGVVNGFNGSRAYLPDDVMGWAGLLTTAGDFEQFHHDVKSLAELNDDRVSFDEIAEFIESEPRGLFMPAEASHAG